MWSNKNARWLRKISHFFPARPRAESCCVGKVVRFTAVPKSLVVVRLCLPLPFRCFVLFPLSVLFHFFLVVVLRLFLLLTRSVQLSLQIFLCPTIVLFFFCICFPLSYRFQPKGMISYYATSQRTPLRIGSFSYSFRSCSGTSLAKARQHRCCTTVNCRGDFFVKIDKTK